MTWWFVIVLAGGVASISPQCVKEYAKTLGELYDNRHLEEAFLGELSKPFVSEKNNKTAIIGVGPGSTGTRSLFVAMAFLGIPSVHYKTTFQPCAWNETNVIQDADSFVKSPFSFWADTPVPQIWVDLLHRLPNAKFISTRPVNVSAWRVKRLAFDHEYCQDPKHPDCQVPVPSRLPRKHMLPLVNATVQQVQGAYDAYTKFMACAIPEERLHVVDVPPTPSAWKELLDFLDLDNMSESRRSELANSTFPHWGSHGCCWGPHHCTAGLQPQCRDSWTRYPFSDRRCTLAAAAADAAEA